MATLRRSVPGDGGKNDMSPNGFVWVIDVLTSASEEKKHKFFSYSFQFQASFTTKEHGLHGVRTDSTQPMVLY